MGAQGALVRHLDGRHAHVPALPIQAVDTTAAGDAFAGALGVALCQHMELIKAVEFACAAGSIAASRPGAQPSMPTPADLTKMQDAMTND
jgi:ribokinase